MKSSESLLATPILSDINSKRRTIERLTILWSIFRVIAFVLTGWHLVTLPVQAHYLR